MKKSHILALILVAAAISIVTAMFLDFSTYETFTSANKPGKKYTVIGYLEKAKPMVYDPRTDANHFFFYAKDKKGNIRQIVYNGSRPTDIEKSEQIVMTGFTDGEVFRCSQIQMKCPSKYRKELVTAKS